jgi:multidrug efflux system outer membrane protein
MSRFRLNHPTARALAVSLTSAFIAGCAVGPDYRAPEPGVDASFVNAEGSAAEPVADFWRGFNDATLNRLIEQALAANHDVRIAVASLREARAARDGIDAERWPSLSARVDAERGIQPQTQAPGTRDERTKNTFNVALDASWEVNFFGRYRRENEAAAANVSAAEAGVNAARVSVVAEVARNYFELRGLQRQLAVAQSALVNQEAAYKLVQAREAAGRGTALDTARALALLEGTRAGVPALEARVQTTSYALAVLTANVPASMQALVREPQPLPGLPAVAGIGTPATLLQRRPDVRIAERQLAAATANIGVAKADLYPRITITGLLGLNAGSVSALSESQAFQYNLGTQMLWNLIDFGRRRAQIGQAEARTEAASLRFEKTVLTALQETEAALVSLNRTQRQTENLFNAAQASEQAAKLARARFDAGVSNFLDVLDAERQVLSDQDRLAQGQTAAATALVSVYKALGGGWPLAERVTEAAR